MGHLTEPTLTVFLVQALILSSYVPSSYLVYRWSRQPLKNEQAERALALLGLPRETPEGRGAGYRGRDFIGPLLTAWFITVVFFAISHPYFTRLGFVAGWVEEIVAIYRTDAASPGQLAGRVFFWGWFGAYAYSFQLTYRRILSYDLNPSVYLFASVRLVFSCIVGAMVGHSVGVFSRLLGASFDLAMMNAFITIFFIGFFPHQGLTWIVRTAQKILKQRDGIAKEVHLSEISGLSLWQQARLEEVGIENAQNLATADVRLLILRTSFPVWQIIDWIDQAILLNYLGGSELAGLRRIGIARASDLLANTVDPDKLRALAQCGGLSDNELGVLRLGLQSAPNMGLVKRARGISSLDPAEWPAAIAA